MDPYIYLSQRVRQIVYDDSVRQPLDRMFREPMTANGEVAEKANLIGANILAGGCSGAYFVPYVTGAIR